MSLFEMLTTSGVSGLFIVLVALALLAAILLTAARLVGAFVTVNRESEVAEKQFGAGDEMGPLTEWHEATGQMLRWPHGLAVLAALALVLGVCGWATGHVAMNMTIAQSPTAPTASEIAGGSAQALAPVVMGSFVATIAMFAYAGFGALFSLLAFIGRRRIMTARAAALARSGKG